MHHSSSNIRHTKQTCKSQLLNCSQSICIYLLAVAQRPVSISFHLPSIFSYASASGKRKKKANSYFYAWPRLLWDFFMGCARQVLVEMNAALRYCPPLHRGATWTKLARYKLCEIASKDVTFYRCRIFGWQMDVLKVGFVNAIS